MSESVDTLIIGASASGLGTAVALQKLGLPFEILDAADNVGSAWRGRYDRLHLHTPKSASQLPGLRMPKGWPQYPSRDQVVEYLERYQAHHRLKPHFQQRVTRVERQGDGWLVSAETPTGTAQWQARSVVMATGNARVPVRPQWPGLETFTGQVLHSGEYRNGRPWRGRNVLVVGFGNSACEQAIDLVESGATHIWRSAPRST